MSRGLKINFLLIKLIPREKFPVFVGTPHPQEETTYSTYTKGWEYTKG